LIGCHWSLCLFAICHAMPLQNRLHILLLRNCELLQISVNIRPLDLHLQYPLCFSQIFHLEALTQFPFDIINPTREKQKVVNVDSNHKELPINDLGENSVICITPFEA